MKVATPAFLGFVKMLSIVEHINITSEDFSVDSGGNVLKWYDPEIEYLCEVYSHGWVDCAKNYKVIK